MDNIEGYRKIITENWSFPEHNGGHGLFGLHPYPAKFIPQIPEKIIEYLEIPKDQLIFDPFCGSGTSLIVGQKLGYEVMGIDLNPIAVLISKVATNKKPENLEYSVERCLNRIKNLKKIVIPDIPNLDHWFEKDIQNSIAKIKQSIEEEPVLRIKDILNLALSSVIVRVSNQESDTRYAAIKKNICSEDVLKLFTNTILSYYDILHESNQDLKRSIIKNQDSLKIKGDDFVNKIGLTITSPPYPNAYEYWLYHKYRMYWLGFDPIKVKETEIGARPHYFRKNPERPEAFEEKMSQLFKVLNENTIKNGYACFVVGDSKIHGEIIDNAQMIINAANKNGFSEFALLPREIKSHRKAFNIKNSRAKSEDILIFRRDNLKSGKVKFYYHNYKYFRYEKIFAARELLSIKGLKSLDIRNDEYIEGIVKSSPSNDFSKLVYFNKIVKNNNSHYTFQSEIENGKNSRKTQNTRYGVHGLHEYKGKFNPQVVRGILNSFNIYNKIVLDPFCGSGTSLIEGALNNNKMIGFDINPFAVFLSNTKIRAISLDTKLVIDVLDKAISFVKKSENYKILYEEREAYLSSWFPEEIKVIIERYRIALQKENEALRNFLLLCMSNILRDYSLQEPQDLRVRRRKTELPTIDIFDALKIEANRNIEKISHYKKIQLPKRRTSRAVEQDIRSKNIPQEFNNHFDFAITSPPYATALPYIDTQRLSSVWLNLIKSSEIRKYEQELIGSREIKKADLDELKNSIESDKKLPKETINICLYLQNKLTNKDGFRKQATPLLLYRYFNDMHLMFLNLYSLLKSNAYFCLIVGTNLTRIGGVETIINTPEFLSIIAKEIGFEIVELIPLETYQRYELHAKNAINKETMIVLRKPHE